jgi:hypothetical protein
MALVPIGKYQARAITMSPHESKQKHTKFWNVVLRIEDEGPQKGQFAEWQGYLTEATQARTLESLSYMGFDGSTPDSIGKNLVYIDVEHETYPEKDDQGQPTGKMITRHRVAWVNGSAGGNRFEQLDATKALQARDELRSLMLAFQANQPQKPSQATQQANAGASFPYGANAPGASTTTPAQTAPQQGVRSKF